MPQEDHVEAERNEIRPAMKRCLAGRRVLLTSRAMPPSLPSGCLHSRVGTRLYMAEPSETAFLSRLESAKASCLRAAFGLSSGHAVFFFCAGPCWTTSRCPGALLLLRAEMPPHPAAAPSDRCGASIYLLVFAVSFSVTPPPPPLGFCDRLQECADPGMREQNNAAHANFAL